MSKDYSADLQAIRYTLDESMFTGQGSVRHHSDSSGALVSYSYDTDLWCDTFSYDAYGHRIDPLADTVNEGLFYTGEQWDNSAQSYYLRARYYDPLNGRFNRVDPYSGNTQDPQSLHKYLYTHNNPVNGIDPTGQFGDFSITGLMTRMAISAVIMEISSPLIEYASGKLGFASKILEKIFKKMVNPSAFMGGIGGTARVGKGSLGIGLNPYPLSRPIFPSYLV